MKTQETPQRRSSLTRLPLRRPSIVGASAPAAAKGRRSSTLNSVRIGAPATERFGSASFGRRMSMKEAVAEAKAEDERKKKLAEELERAKAEPAEPKYCIMSGDGLKTSMALQKSVFTIEARDKFNQRRVAGGDHFMVTVRGASTAKVRVHDNNDGTYRCEFTPSVSGQYHITASHGGVLLGGSPYTIDILAPVADPDKCICYGEALASIVAREPSSFSIEFIDTLANMCHAEELDVFVTAREPPPPVKVGPTAAEIAAEEARIEEERLAAEKAVEDASREASGAARGRRRTHIVGGANSDAARDAMLLAQQMKAAEAERLRTGKTVSASDLAARLKESQGPATSSGRATSKGSSSGKRTDGAPGTAVSGSGGAGGLSSADAVNGAGAGGVQADEPPELTLDSLKAITFTELPRIIDIWRTFDRDKSGKVDMEEFKKGLSSAFPNAREKDIKKLFKQLDGDHSGTVEYSELMAKLNPPKRGGLQDSAKKAKDGDEAGSGQKTGAGGDGTDGKDADGKEASASAPTPAPAPAQATSGTTRKAHSARKHHDRPGEGHRGSRTFMRKSAVLGQSLAGAVAVPADGTPAMAAAMAVSMSGEISPPRSRVIKQEEKTPIAPKLPKGFNPFHPTHPLVDGAERQRHMRLWQKQQADEQSRKAAEEFVAQLLRERFSTGIPAEEEAAAAELKAAAAGPSFASEIGNEDRPGSPRKKIDGFAFGGLYPGTIHARGELFKAHTCHYAIGRAGCYWLHVGLHQTAQPVAGSPFKLIVLPGAAHALSTKIPLAAPESTIVGTAGRMIVHASDRMGNPCQSGGDPLKASDPTGVVQCSTKDLEDGRYEISFQAELSGTFNVHVAVAGSSCYGSPTQVTMLPSGPDVGHFEVVGTGLNRALAGRHAYLRVRSKDCFGNATLPNASMVLGMVIIPQVTATVPQPKVTTMREDGGDEEEEVEEVEKPKYSDDDIYGVTKAAADAKRAVAAAEAAAAEQKALSEVPAVVQAAEEVAAPAPASERKGKGGRRQSIGAAAESPAAAPAAAPARKNKESSDVSMGLTTEGKSTKQMAEERKAVEAAAKAHAKNHAEKIRLQEEALAAAAAAAAEFEPKDATVQSIDFEGAWRAGGEYEMRYVFQEAGNFALHIWCDVEGNGERHRLPGSPFHLFVSASAPSHAGSSVGGIDKVKYAAGEAIELYPQLRDVFGNPTAAVEKHSSFGEQKSVAASIMKELLSQHGMGPLKAVQHTLSHRQWDAAAVESPDFLPSSPVRRSLVDRTFSSPDVSPTKGRRSRKDLIEPPSKGPTNELTAWLIGPKGTVPLALKKEDSELGRYEVDNHIVTMSGQYEAHFALNGRALKNSPVMFEVVASNAYGKYCYVTAPEQPAFAKLPYELKLHTLDKHGNKLSWGGSKVEGRIVGSSGAACTVVDHKDGTYSLHFTVNTTGSFNVEVRIDGAKVKGTEAAAQPFLSEAAEAEKRAEKKLRKEERRKAKEEAARAKEAEEALARSLEVPSPVQSNSPNASSPVNRRPARRGSIAGKRQSLPGSDLIGKAVAGLVGAAQEPTPDTSPQQKNAPTEEVNRAPAPAPRTEPPLEVQDLTAPM